MFLTGVTTYSANGGEIHILLDILYANKSYYNINNFIYDNFGVTIEMDRNVHVNTGPGNEYYSIFVWGDFDNMQFISNNNGLYLKKNENTTKMPTWIAIEISCEKASLFNIDHTPYGDLNYDRCALMSYTYIDLSQASWNQPNT